MEPKEAEPKKSEVKQTEAKKTEPKKAEGEEKKVSGTESPGFTAAWQAKLLPFMACMVVGLTAFFFIVSFIQISRLHGRIEQCPSLNLAETLDKPGGTEPGTLDSMRWKTLSLLEEHALQRRYHQANVLLMSRVWIRYLGFVTGMILALVGAAFILGKLREAPSTLEADTGSLKLSLKSASPGLILAVLGTLLMVTAMVTHHEITVKDVPTYTLAWFGSTTSAKQPLSSPRPLETGDGILDQMKMKLEEKTDEKPQ